MKQALLDVAVVGGGVVGAALSLDLRRRGFGVALVERGPGPAAFDPAHYDLRVYALAPAATGYLDHLGVWAGVRAQRACAYETMRVWEDQPAQALNFDAAELRLPQLGHIVEHDLLAGRLWQALDGVDIRRSGSVESLTVGADAATLVLSDGSSLRARLVVAADGADSALRELAGIETVGWPYPQQAIVCIVRTQKPHRACAWQRFLPAGPLALLPLADGRGSIVWSSREAGELLALDDAAFRARLGEALQGELGEILECGPRVAFPLRLLHARRYAAQRVVLAGDAAHAIHPLAGQGVNLGLADAQLLAQQLAQARAQQRDPGNLRVLRRYERARQADNLDMLAMTDGLFRAFDARGGGWDGLRLSGMNLVRQLAPLKNYFARRASAG